ncbi:MAG: hypothetical protein Kow0074_11830 [Candidatus Zixiibacteriota bacterium]
MRVQFKMTVRQLLAIVCAVLVHSSSIAQSSYGEFQPYQLGYPVAEYRPVDIDDDGVWELAIRTSETPVRYGVYAFAEHAWLDGPRTLPSEPRYWGVADYDRDGALEYAYQDHAQIRLLDIATLSNQLLWQVDSNKAGAAMFWGRDSDGDHLVAIRHHSDYSYDQTEQYPYIWTSGYNTKLYIHELLTGTYKHTVNASMRPDKFVPAQPMSEGMRRLVSESVYEHSSSFPDFNYYFERIHLVNESWEDVSLSTYYGFQGAVFPPAPLKTVHFASIAESGSQPVCFFLLCDRATTFSQPNVGMLQVSDGQSDWQTWEDRPFVYSDIEAFDIDANNDIEWILVRSDGVGWEIRRSAAPETPMFEPGLPTADLQTGPLEVNETSNLFYIEGDQIFVWKPGVVTDVSDETIESIPDNFVLRAYPNPFNSAVTLTWNHVAVGAAKITLVNTLGHTVRTLDAGSGESSVLWDARDQRGNPVPSGIYFARLTARNTTSVVRIIHLK